MVNLKTTHASFGGNASGQHFQSITMLCVQLTSGTSLWRRAVNEGVD